MKRTLALLAVTGAFLVPATAASAGNAEHKPDLPNASCNNGKGGNGAVFNGHGNSGKAVDCASVVVTPTPTPTPAPGDDSEAPAPGI